MAVQLNGSSQYLQRDCTGDALAPLGVHFTSPFTIAGWVKRSGGAGTEMGIFALHNTQTGNAPSVVMEHSPSNTLVGYLDANSSVAPGKTFSTDEWVYCVVRWDGTLTVSYALEADSALTTSSTTAGNNQDAANWLTFGRWPSGLYFNGVLAHLRAWSEDMSDANLLLEKASPTLVRTTNNYGAWELTANGNSSNGSRHLTMYGSPSYVDGPTLGASAVAKIAGRHFARMRA